MKVCMYKDNMKQIANILIIAIALPLIFNSCSKKDDPNPTSGCGLEEISNSSNVRGFNILEKLSGIWNGPVYSPTPIGSYPEWIVDFRPISGSQVAAKNELDSINDIFMSFFVVKHDCEYKIAFRNGGSFAGHVRNSYMMIDSLSEDSSLSFYRFVDPVSGGNRVYSSLHIFFLGWIFGG